MEPNLLELGKLRHDDLVLRTHQLGPLLDDDGFLQKQKKAKMAVNNSLIKGNVEKSILDDRWF